MRADTSDSLPNRIVLKPTVVSGQSAGRRPWDPGGPVALSPVDIEDQRGGQRKHRKSPRCLRVGVQVDLDVSNISQIGADVADPSAYPVAGRTPWGPEMHDGRPGPGQAQFRGARRSRRCRFGPTSRRITDRRVSNHRAMVASAPVATEATIMVVMTV